MPEGISPSQYPYPSKKRNSFFYWKIVIVLFVVIAILGFLFVKGYLTKTPVVSGSGYDAVFLDNNQVYFGKIENLNDKTMTLENIYYLAPNQTVASGQPLSLIKLGSELHGPTDEMFISMTHVLFYENLRPDSQVVQSIENNPTGSTQ